MSAFQFIIDTSSNITLGRRRTGGHTQTRGGQIRINSIANAVPYSIVVTPRPVWKWDSNNRSLLEDLENAHFAYSGDVPSQVTNHTINIGSSNPNLNWMTRYHGDFTLADLAQCHPDSGTNSGLSVSIDVTSVRGNYQSGDAIFRSGDFIQLDSGYRYPYQVTADVILGAPNVYQVPIHRPLIQQAGYTFNSAKGFLAGPDVTWVVAMVQKPDIEFFAHGKWKFTDNFIFQEIIED